MERNYYAPNRIQYVLIVIAVFQNGSCENESILRAVVRCDCVKFGYDEGVSAVGTARDGASARRSAAAAGLEKAAAAASRRVAAKGYATGFYFPAPRCGCSQLPLLAAQAPGLSQQRQRLPPPPGVGCGAGVGKRGESGRG